MALLPPIKKIDDLNDEWDKDTIKDYHDPNIDLELLIHQQQIMVQML